MAEIELACHCSFCGGEFLLNEGTTLRFYVSGSDDYGKMWGWKVFYSPNREVVLTKAGLHLLKRKVSWFSGSIEYRVACEKCLNVALQQGYKPLEGE